MDLMRVVFPLGIKEHAWIRGNMEYQKLMALNLAT